jgi:glutaredoxin
MASRSRRTQAIIAFAALALIYMLFFSAESSSSFRSRTESAITRKHSPLRGDLSDADLQAQTNEKLQQVLSAKGEQDDYWKHAPTDRTGQRTGVVVLQGTRTTQATAKPHAENLDEVPVAGRKTMPKPTNSAARVTPEQRKQEMLKDKEKPKYPKTGDGEEEAFNGNKIESAADPGEEMARHELQSILKKSPIIIFSKSYCPYSKRAKNILLDLYEITPKPWVVELDQMTEMVPKKKSTNGDEDEGQEATLGKKVQDLLQSLTGRRTVPNIMINSQSLGGSDEVVKLDRENELSEKIKQMGGKRIVSVERKAGKES